jgi:hypothetical protein
VATAGRETWRVRGSNSELQFGDSTRRALGVGQSPAELKFGVTRAVVTLNFSSEIQLAVDQAQASLPPNWFGVTCAKKARFVLKTERA